MLADSPGGCTESILLAHGFGIATLHDLVDSGFATAERRTVRAERRLIGATWLAITDAGRRRLARRGISDQLPWPTFEIQHGKGDKSARVPLTGLGKVHDFQGNTISQLIALTEAKLGARAVKSRKHDQDVLRIES
jgi:hypothetical protein